MSLYVLEYTGTFGFIKPSFAIRDEETLSQSFVTESILIGIELRLFEGLQHNGVVNYIKRNKLFYESISIQQEKTMLELKQIKPKTKPTEAYGIIKRGLLINPKLYLAFDDLSKAEIAINQCISLTRNEDLLIPKGVIYKMTHDEFDEIIGNEYIKTGPEGVCFGSNRFNNYLPMYGEIKYKV